VLSTEGTLVNSGLDTMVREVVVTYFELLTWLSVGIIFNQDKKFLRPDSDPSLRAFKVGAATKLMATQGVT
jgi:hypothetical protein